ncbi:MAG: thioredoxin-disulfide reductase [Candidatus Omnitrophica bacterium]|nr:thioredoxin-disulfide reductase [Candidatus Omnitrophota bacterium]
MAEQIYDVIIIGAGPAGLTAALYCGRYRMRTLLLEKMVVGGQILLSASIENFPGFPQGVVTAELIERMKKQIENLNIFEKNAEATGINIKQHEGYPLFTVNTTEGDFQAYSLIIATGAHWKRLGVPGEQRFIGKGVSFCGTCDAPLFRKKEICVVGGGDKAIEEAIFLSGYASKVTVIHRRATLRAIEILQEQAKAKPNISFIFNSVVTEIKGDNTLEGVYIRSLNTEEKTFISCQGVFIFIGIQPNTEFLKGIIDLDDSGFVKVNSRKQTSCAGIFACGDCIEKHLYQVITACAEGAEAAHSAHNYILHQHRK